MALLHARHTAVVNAVADLARGAGWTVYEELSVSTRSPRRNGRVDLLIEQGPRSVLIECKSKLTRHASCVAEVRDQCEFYRDATDLPVVVVAPAVPSGWECGFETYSVAAFALWLRFEDIEAA